MTKEQEAQQAQTIANVRNLVARDLAWAKQANGYCGEISSQPYLERLPALLEIVDSQAQKIADQANEIERLKPKQYTEEELYKAWRDAPECDTGSDPEGWLSAKWCARFLGALKE